MIAEYVKNSYDLPIKRKIAHRNWAKDLKIHFFKEDIHMAKKYMKRCLKSLATREVQIKTTMRYHFTFSGMAIIKITENNKFGRM